MTGVRVDMWLKLRNILLSSYKLWNIEVSLPINNLKINGISIWMTIWLYVYVTNDAVSKPPPPHCHKIDRFQIQHQTDRLKWWTNTYSNRTGNDVTNFRDNQHKKSNDCMICQCLKIDSILRIKTLKWYRWTKNGKWPDNTKIR